MKIIVYKSLISSKIKFYMFLLIFIIIILNGLNLTTHYINNKINNDILNKVENRSFYVTCNNNIKKIEKIEHIEYISYDFQPVEVNYNNIRFYAKIFNKFIQKYDKIDDLNHNEIIISEAMAKQFHFKKNNIIIIKYLEKSFEFKVKEIYSDRVNMGNYIYISEQSQLINYIDEKNSYFILIDDYSNYNEAINNLETFECKLKFKNSDYENELLTYQDVLLNLNFFFAITYLILVFCLSLILVLNIVEKKYNISLLKNFGYSNYKILKILIFEHLFFLTMIYAINLFIFKITSHIIFSLTNIHFFNISIIVKNFFIMVGLLVLISGFLIFKIRKICLIKLLKN